MQTSMIHKSIHWTVPYKETGKMILSLSCSRRSQNRRVQQHLQFSHRLIISGQHNLSLWGKYQDLIRWERRCRLGQFWAMVITVLSTSSWNSTAYIYLGAVYILITSYFQLKRSSLVSQLMCRYISSFRYCTLGRCEPRWLITDLFWLILKLRLLTFSPISGYYFIQNPDWFVYRYMNIVDQIKIEVRDFVRQINAPSLQSTLILIDPFYYFILILKFITDFDWWTIWK